MKENQLFSCQLSCHQRKALPQFQGSQLASGSGQGVAEGSGTGLTSCWSLTLPAHRWWEWQSCVLRLQEVLASDVFWEKHKSKQSVKLV